MRFLDGPTLETMPRGEGRVLNRLQFHLELDSLRVYFRKEHTVSEGCANSTINFECYSDVFPQPLLTAYQVPFFTLRFNLQ